MKKILIVLFFIVGMATSVNYLPETTLKGNFNTGGYEISGSEFVDEVDIDWSTMPIINFVGTTGEDLATCISTYGDKHIYVIQNDVIVSSELNITNNQIRITGLGTRTSTEINCTGSSGIGINITGYDVVLDNLYIYQSTAGLDTLIKYECSEHSISIQNSYIAVIDGTAILFSNSYRPEILNCFITGNSTNSGTGLILGSASHQTYSPMIAKTWFTNLETSIEMVDCAGPRLSELYTYANPAGDPHVGIHLNPHADGEVLNIEIYDSIIDYGVGASGYAMYAPGTYETVGLWCRDTYFWARDTDAILLNNVEYIDFDNAHISSNAGTGLNITSSCTGPITIDDCNIYAELAGILISGCNNTIISNNFIDLYSGTVAIELNNCVYNIVDGNRCVESNVKLLGNTNFIMVTDNLYKDFEDYTGAANTRYADNLKE